MSVFNAKSVDPDQTPRFAASDLSLHCPLSLLWVTRHKRVKNRFYCYLLTLGSNISFFMKTYRIYPKYSAPFTIPYSSSPKI